MSLSKRQRRNRVKADLLDGLSMTAREYEYAYEENRHGLSQEDAEAAAEEVAQRLNRMALRLDEGDPEEDGWDKTATG